jgi:signal peptidase
MGFHASEPGLPARSTPDSEENDNLVVLPLPEAEGLTASEVAELFGFALPPRPAAPAAAATPAPERHAAQTTNVTHSRPARPRAPKRPGREWARPRRSGHPHRVRRAITPAVALPKAARAPRRAVLEALLTRATSALLVLSLMLGWAILALTIAQHVWGYNSYVVLSGSMRPTIPVGTLVLDQSVPASQVVIGDIVSFHPLVNPNETITHRVVEIQPNPPGARAGLYAKTRGDANPTPDPGWLPLDGNINRVVVWVPVAGYAVAFLEQPVARILLVIVPLALMATMILSAIWRSPR